MNTHTPRYCFKTDVALTYDDTMQEWAVVTGPLHPYGVDVVRYPSYTAALRAYRGTRRDALERDAS